MSDIVSTSAQDLTRPLGAGLKARARASIPAQTIFAILSGMMLVVIAGQIFLGARQDPNADIVAVINVRPETAPAARAERAEAPAAADRPSEPRYAMTAEESENAAGVKVVRGGGAAAPGSLVITVPPTEAAEPKLSTAPDRRLIERSRHGTLPRVGPDGARPATVYARPVPPAAAGKPRIAIVVGGLGIGQSSTADAISKLPGGVTLAFAPYASDLDRQVSRARNDGHEVLLQMPMEPFDYPENDPGPHTLRASADPADNIDRLHWVMSRFSGYTGIVNFMGGKFTAQEQALRPVMKDMADRGLVLLDDGSSNRSMIGDIAPSVKIPSARADANLDALARPDAIDKELARLESIAREKGIAIGTASAIPLTVDRIARWAKTLNDRGIVLVPAAYAIQARKAAP